MKASRHLLPGALFVLVTALTLAHSTAGNSDGANEGTASSGCTCHSTMPNTQTTVTLEGLPESAEPNMTYNLTVRVAGPASVPAPAGQNQGGFALAVDAGALAPADDKTQLKGEMLTHTQAGNDQRSWPVLWTAPAQGGNATFVFAGNAVNGDSLQDPVDAWNKAEASVVVAAPAPPPPSPSPTPQQGDETPVASWMGLVSLFVGAFVLARRRA